MSPPAPLSKSELQALSAFSHELADLSEASLLAHFRQPGQVDDKAPAGPFDPVTDADREAETAIRAAIAAAYPDHRIVGEEFGETGSGGVSWLIDPIDGTKSFITGSPLWGTLIGLMVDGRPALGLMNQPFTKERFWSDGNSTSFRGGDGRTIGLRTRSCSRMDQAILSTTSIDLLQPGDERERFEALSGLVRMRRFGGDCYSYCLLASGHIDLVVETGLKPHDIAALIPIIEHAGGTVSTWDGADPTAGGQIVAAGDAQLHAAVLDCLSGG